MQGQGFTCCPWIGRTYITVQWSMLQYSDWIFNSRIFLLIYSSVGYRNLSHQVIEDSSQHNHFNNLYGTVSMPQILCCINCISLSFEFYWNFRAHTCHLSFVFSIGEGAKSRALLKVRLTIFIGHCLAEWSFSMQLCSIDGNRRNTNEVMSHCGNSMRTLNIFSALLHSFNFNPLQ